MTWRSISLVLAAIVLCGGACDREGAGTGAAGSASQPASVPTRRPATASSPLPRVVFLGDSLTAGLGVDADEAFPALVSEMLKADGRPVEVVNAGVSGDTTAGGLRRLDWILRQKPNVVVVGLGGNDGLRGLKLEASEENLRAIVHQSRHAGATVLLLGMMIPPNYGPEYTSQFRDLYPRLGRELDVALVPFVLEGVGGDARFNQADGIHPTPEGHRIIAKNVLPHLRALLPESESFSETGSSPQE